MIQLPCPWCGYRNVSEFAYHGEQIPRPDPATTTRAAWRRYLYMRKNPAGPLREGWYHRAGCRRFFEAERDTTDNTVFGSWAPFSPEAANATAGTENEVRADMASKGASK